MLGPKRRREHLSQLPLVFDDEDAHAQHVIEVGGVDAASLTQMSERCQASRCSRAAYHSRQESRDNSVREDVYAKDRPVRECRGGCRSSASWSVADSPQHSSKPNPRQQPGAMITMYAPEQHDLYDGHYVLSANRIHMVGGLNDPVGWDHLDNEAKTVKPVSGTAEIDVNDLDQHRHSSRRG